MRIIAVALLFASRLLSTCLAEYELCAGQIHDAKLGNIPVVVRIDSVTGKAWILHVERRTPEELGEMLAEAEELTRKSSTEAADMMHDLTRQAQAELAAAGNAYFNWAAIHEPLDYAAMLDLSGASSTTNKTTSK